MRFDYFDPLQMYQRAAGHTAPVQPLPALSCSFSATAETVSCLQALLDICRAEIEEDVSNA